MNKPRVLIGMATVRRFRSEQTLTRLFQPQPMPGAVLLSALPLGQEQTCRVRLRDYHGFLVKHVGISLFNLVFTQVFTLSPPKVLRERNIHSRNLKSSGRKTTKTGGSDPTFSAFSRPKSFVGSLPPVLCATQNHTTNRELRPRQIAVPLVNLERADHEAPLECRIKACMAGPREGEHKKCQS
jgi:hypothetical protein